MTGALCVGLITKSSRQKCVKSGRNRQCFAKSKIGKGKRENRMMLVMTRHVTWVSDVEQNEVIVTFSNTSIKTRNVGAARVILKAEWQEYGMVGVMGMAGAYYAGARMRPQLIGCALTQEPGCP